MNLYEERFEGDDKSKFKNQQVKEKLVNLKAAVEKGAIYENIESIEDALRICHENEFSDEGLFFSEALIIAQPYNPEGWKYNGIFLNNSFQFDDAYTSFNKALALNPNDSETLVGKALTEDNMQLEDDAIMSLKLAISLDQNNDEAFFSLGLIYQRREQFVHAIDCFSKAIKIDPTYSDAFYELAYCFEREKNFPSSLAAYDDFLQLEPYNSSGWYNRGIILTQLNQINEALNSFDLACAINDSFSSAWFNKGAAYAALGLHNQALEAFQYAFALEASDPSIPYNIAQVYEDMNENENAILYYTKAIEISENYYEALIARGLCYLTQKRYHRALDDFNLAIQLTPDDPSAWAHKARTENILGNKFEAAKSYKNALAIEPDNPDLWKLYAETLIKNNDFLAGIEAYKRRLQCNPYDAYAYYDIAKLNFKLGKIAEAYECLKLAFNFNPELKKSLKNEYLGDPLLAEIEKTIGVIARD